MVYTVGMAFSKHAHRLLIVLSVIVILMGGVALLIANYAGGFGNIRKNFTKLPDPESPELATLRKTLTTDIEKEFAAIDEKTGLTVKGTDVLDECYKGQNNKLTRDGFAHRCSYRKKQYFGYTGDFTAQTMGQFQYLASLGWGTSATTYTNGITKTANAYKDLPTVNADPATLLNGGQNAKKGDFAMGITYQDIRNAIYLTSSMTDAQDILPNATSTVEYTKKSVAQLTKVIPSIAMKDQYLFTISIEKDYFMN